jgi:hypothetical protein
MTSFEVADNRSIAVIAPPSPIINADDIKPIAVHSCSSAYNAKQRILAHGQHQPSGKACRTPPTERQAEMMDDAVDTWLVLNWLCWALGRHWWWSGR